MKKIAVIAFLVFAAACPFVEIDPDAVFACESDGVCQPGHQCVQGYCYPIDQIGKDAQAFLPDASVDSGSADASELPDAQEFPDASEPPDAGFSDASEPADTSVALDVGIPDTGTPDTGDLPGPDAGTPDTGDFPGPDAGIPDSGFEFRAIPVIAKSAGLSTALINGDQEILGWTVTAPASGPDSFARFTFRAALTGYMQFMGVGLYRNGTLLTTTELKLSFDNTKNPVEIIAVFVVEEVVAADVTNAYSLHGVILDSVVGNTLTTSLVCDTVPAAGLSGPTGSVYGTSEALYDTPDGVCKAASPLTVWSDMSDPAHSYPVITSTCQVSGGSADYADGHWLSCAGVSHTKTR